MTSMSSARRPVKRQEILPQSSSPWHEGYRAGRDGKGSPKCPYAVGTGEGWSWSSGYVEGKAARFETRQSSIDANTEH
jgi:ribosome modulation factor